ENAFKMAASMAFKDGMRKASPVLLEPMMAVEVETPEDFMGNVMGDLSSRHRAGHGRQPDGQGHQGRSAARRDVRLFDDTALAVPGSRDVHDGVQALHRGAEERRRGSYKQEDVTRSSESAPLLSLDEQDSNRGPHLTTEPTIRVAKFN